MTLKKALRFVLFPTWHMARAHDLFAMAEAWKAAAGDRAAEIDPALNAFHAIRDQPAFARAQDALAIHIERIFTLIGHEEINDHTKIQPTSISVLSSLRRSKIDQAAKSLEDVRASLPRGALKQEVEAALRIMQSPEWKVPQNALATSLGQLRDVLSKTSAYQEVKAELQRSFTALKSLHEHVFEEGIDHGVLANHEWLVHMRTHHPALFDRVIEAADEGHIHIRHVGLNDPDIAGEVLDWRRHPETMIQKIRGAPVAAATPVPKANGRTTSGTSSLPHTAEELAAPEIDAARLGRACPAELPAAEAAIRDLKKLGIITAIVGAAVAAAAILSHRHARDRTEAMTPRAAWQVRTQQNHADSKSPSL